MSYKLIRDKFFEFERKNDLFKYTSSKQLPIWDVIRWDVLYAIKFKPQISKRFVEEKTFCTRVGLIIKSILFLCKDSFLLLKCLIKRKEFFFFSARRFRKNGYSYDPFLEDFIKAIDSNLCFEFGAYNTDDYKHNGAFAYDLRNWLYPILRRFKFVRFISNSDKCKIKEISVLVKNEFGITIDHKELLWTYERFIWDYGFFSLLFKFQSFSHVFFVAAGIQKGLILAAHKHGISVSEFQHGDVTSETINYQYCLAGSTFSNKIITPDNFLVFSKLWIKDISRYIKSNCIVVGSDFFYKRKQKLNYDEKLVVISSVHHNSVLSSLTAELAVREKNLHIYYKLHPSQFSESKFHKNFFKNNKNVTVISDDYTISELVEIADEFVAIYSTAIYEVLQAGKILYIYKVLDYMSFNDFFNLDNVYLFDNIVDFIKMREVAFERYTKNSSLFFEPFNSEKIKNLIK